MAVEASSEPTVCRRSETTAAATATTITGRQLRVRPALPTMVARAAAVASHGHQDDPGTQSTSPVIRARWPPTCSGTCQRGITTWRRWGARRTCGGSEPVHCARASCQTTRAAPLSRCQSGGAAGSGLAALGSRLPGRWPASHVGERWFSSTPPSASTRRYGSRRAPSTMTCWPVRLISSSVPPISAIRTWSPSMDGLTARMRVR